MDKRKKPLMTPDQRQKIEAAVAKIEEQKKGMLQAVPAAFQQLINANFILSLLYNSQATLVLREIEAKDEAAKIDAIRKKLEPLLLSWHKFGVSIKAIVPCQHHHYFNVVLQKH